MSDSQGADSAPLSSALILGADQFMSSPSGFALLNADVVQTYKTICANPLQELPQQQQAATV
jgi:hypothetical protein